VSTVVPLDSVTEVATEAPPGSVRVDLTVKPFRFMPDQLTVPAGDVVFFLVNATPEGGSGTHVLSIGAASRKEVAAASGSVAPGESASFTVMGLEAGDKFTIWCPIEPHAAQGMVGTLTVE
jgi:plastocyanin